MNLEKPSAFTPLLSDGVDVTCTRRSGTTVTTHTGRISVSVMPGGDPADGGGQARVSGGQFSVFLRDDGYPASGGPAFGDRFTHSVYGVLTVQAAQQDGDYWTCQCVGRMGAPHQ